MMKLLYIIVMSLVAVVLPTIADTTKSTSVTIKVGLKVGHVYVCKDGKASATPCNTNL